LQGWRVAAETAGEAKTAAGELEEQARLESIAVLPAVTRVPDRRREGIECALGIQSKGLSGSSFASMRYLLRR
jgi:hypothetical protein